MGSFFKKISLALLVLGLLYGGLWVLSKGDPVYFVQEKLSVGDWGKYDATMARVAQDTGVDFYLIKAVIWQESRFGANKIGTAGERGLMQVTEAAAEDWAKATNAVDFSAEKLLDPETNITVGAWYLKRALDHYKKKDRPLSFALTEYNAGRTRVKRWIGQSEAGASPMSAEQMKEKSFESTREYVESIERRYEYYKKMGSALFVEIVAQGTGFEHLFVLGFFHTFHNQFVHSVLALVARLIGHMVSSTACDTVTIQHVAMTW
jgi:soluble lytic murein transglycosylase